MKKQFLFLSILFITSLSMMAQTEKTNFVPSGAPLFKIFWNYTNDLTPNTAKKSAFALDRAYFGYKYDFSSAISAKVIFDVGNDAALSAYTAYLKAAQLDWKVANGVKLSMGMIGLKQFSDQEDFWGYRYMYKTFGDQNGFSSAADLGVNAEFSLAKNLKLNVLVVNGEGYKSVESTGNQKIGGSLVYTPIKGLTTKVYFDSQSATDKKSITSLALFAGYKAADWRLGAEYNTLANGTDFKTFSADQTKLNKLNGVSFYGAYSINKKLEVVGRFDQMKSNTLTGASTAWNSKDGNLIIAGLQYAPVKGLKLALNYQGYNFAQSGLTDTSKILLNAEFNL